MSRGSRGTWQSGVALSMSRTFGREVGGGKGKAGLSSVEEAEEEEDAVLCSSSVVGSVGGGLGRGSPSRKGTWFL